MVVNAKGTYAYVANSGTDSVSAVDLVDDKVSATIPLGASPTGLAISPNGGELYVSSNLASPVPAGMRSLLVIDTAKRRVVDRVNVGNDSSDVVLSPKGTYAYVNAIWVHIVDTTTREDVATISQQSGNPGDLQVSPDGRTLYLITSLSLRSTPGSASKLLVVDVATRRIKASIDLATKSILSDLALDPEGSRIFVAADTVSPVSVWSYSTASNEETAAIRAGEGATGIAFSPNGKLAYVCTAEDTLVVVNAATGTVTARMELNYTPGGPTPRAVAINPDGKQAYIANWNFFDPSQGTLTVVNLPRE